MAAKAIDNGQCEAPTYSKETPGGLLVTVQEAPEGQAEGGTPKPSLKRFEDLPEMVEMLSPLRPDDDGDKTDVENLSDHEDMDTAEQKTALVGQEEDSNDENQTDVEDVDIEPVKHQVMPHHHSPPSTEESKSMAKQFIQEVQLDNLECKKIPSDSKWLRGDSNHIGRKPSHSRQRSHSQPCSLSSPGAVEVCQSASSETEFANLSAHVRAVLGEMDVRTQKYKISGEAKRSKLRYPSSGLPYRLTSRTDQERLLRKFFVEEDVGSLTDEGEFVIMPEPRSPTCRLTAGLEELDVSSDGTDIEDLAVESHHAIGSGGEWTETDPDSGEVRHIISKTTHTTVTSKKPNEGTPRGDTTSTTVSHSSKDGHHGSTSSAPSERDEVESLTFFQKKEFFEKLSEQSPPQEAFSARLGSTPSLDTALTRPAVTLKPRPRSESLTSQGEIIEESIVFAERLRLFQNGAQASPLPTASIPQADLMDPASEIKQKLQGMPGIGDTLQPVSSAVLEGLQSTEERSDTRLLVHTSDANKEAFDVRSVQVAEDVGDKQFSHMRVRMPVSEETVSKTSICSSDLPGEKPSPLRDAYKDSLSPSRQEGSQAGKQSLPGALGDDTSVCLVHEATTDLTLSKAGPLNQTNKDIAAFDRQPVSEQSPLLSSQSQMLASGLQMGIVAGSGILQEGIKASPQSAILDTFSSSATEITGLETPKISRLLSEEAYAGSAEEAGGNDMGRIGAVLAAAPVAVLPVRDIISAKQLEMLDIAQVSEESNIFESCVELPSQVESQICPKEKTIMKTEYADIQHKLSSAFGESLAAAESKATVTQGVPKEVLEALDRSSQEFVASKLDEDSEQDTNILSATQGSVSRDFLPDQIESTLDRSAVELAREEPTRDVHSTPGKTAACLTPEQLEIQAIREVAEERQEEPEVLVALNGYPKSTLRESDSYDKNLKEFITVLEDYEPVPDGQLSEWKRASPAFEPSIQHDSEITATLSPVEAQKAAETVRNILDSSENASELLGDDTQSQSFCEDMGLLTDDHVRTAGHRVISTTESDHDGCLLTLSEPVLGKERGECLDYDSALGVRGQESSLPKELYEEHSLDLARSEDEQVSLVEDSMNVPTESSVIDYPVVGHSGVVKDTHTQPKGSKFDLHEISHTGDKTEDLPLSYGDDEKRNADFPRAVSEITVDMAIKDSYSEHLSQDTLQLTASTVLCEGGRDVPYSSDEDQHNELSRYKEVELAIPFLRGASSSLEDEVEDGGSFSSGDLQAEKIAEFLTADPDTMNQVVHFPQIFQDYDRSAHREPCVPTETAVNVEKRVGFILDERAAGSAPCVPVKPDRQVEIEEASRIVENVVHIASSLVESLGEVDHETAVKEYVSDSELAYATGSPLERSEVSETLSQAGPPSTIEKDQRESPFGVKEMYQVLKESRGPEDRIQYSVTSLGDPLFVDEVDEDQERRRRGSPTAESLDDQAQIEKCSHEVMMQLLDGFSQSDVELAEVRTEDEAPDIEDDVPSPEAGSQEEKSAPLSQDNSGDLQPQLSTEVEIGSQASGAPAPLSELDYELCPDADQLRTSGDEAVATRVLPLEPGSHLHDQH